MNPDEGWPESELGDGSDHVSKSEDGDEELEAGGVEDMDICSDDSSSWRL